jgi:hypothetical protein
MDDVSLRSAPPRALINTVPSAMWAVAIIARLARSGRGSAPAAVSTDREGMLAA